MGWSVFLYYVCIISTGVSTLLSSHQCSCHRTCRPFCFECTSLISALYIVSGLASLSFFAHVSLNLQTGLSLIGDTYPGLPRCSERGHLQWYQGSLHCVCGGPVRSIWHTQRRCRASQRSKSTGVVCPVRKYDSNSMTLAYQEPQEYRCGFAEWRQGRSRNSCTSRAQVQE